MMVAWRYEFDDARFFVLSTVFIPIELTAMTAHGGIIVHRADDYALSIIMDGKVTPWVDRRVVLDCKGRTFVRDSFLNSDLEIESV